MGPLETLDGTQPPSVEDPGQSRVRTSVLTDSPGELKGRPFRTLPKFKCREEVVRTTLSGSREYFRVSSPDCLSKDLLTFFFVYLLP